MSLAKVAKHIKKRADLALISDLSELPHQLNELIARCESAEPVSIDDIPPDTTIPDFQKIAVVLSNLKAALSRELEEQEETEEPLQLPGSEEPSLQQVAAALNHKYRR